MCHVWSVKVLLLQFLSSKAFVCEFMFVSLCMLVREKEKTCVWKESINKIVLCASFTIIYGWELSWICVWVVCCTSHTAHSQIPILQALRNSNIGTGTPVLSDGVPEHCYLISQLWRGAVVCMSVCVCVSACVCPIPLLSHISLCVWCAICLTASTGSDELLSSTVKWT